MIFIETSFSEYKDNISQTLNIDFSRAAPYKICDIRPAYGHLYKKYLEGYDFFGFGDIDVIYGNLRHFLTDDILARYQLIATHPNRISGHFSLFKNNDLMRNAYKKIPDWKVLFETPEHLSLDESKFTKVFIPHRKHPRWIKKIYALFSPYWRNNYFHEQYSTILSPIPWLDGSHIHPEEWYWKDGILSNNKDGKRDFMYLHFMNWKSSTWLHKEYGTTVAWSSEDTVFQFNSNSTKNGFVLNRQGIHDIK